MKTQPYKGTGVMEEKKMTKVLWKILEIYKEQRAM